MVILMLILMNVQFLRDVVSSFEKGWNSQNHSSSDSRKPMKNLLHSKIFNCIHLAKFSPTPKWYLEKTWIIHLHDKRIFEKDYEG